ncbi:hypothetical protein TanjilG_33010 [Lupinus angustifolius]|uniref:Bifunctional inhibitor/plant lipid transfer protein/seed storage helical domain-containing protein n=1 Tax=Lupinus angustifolius TaxID=3871 RepID=A0A4P1RNF5_LUPAN|nr:PREDICTED: non-specific lipid transfer protein GPI-anchored 1-like [Lupinus angustifolius]OIW14668.1 hypothetical protein TanjilG_33010 [Lupinus angustifolius]
MKNHETRVHELISLSFFVLIVCGTLATVNGADDLATKCGQVVEKVIPCLSFATGKAATPTKECCDAATEIKESNPQCLCYIIQQTHKGSPQSKQMGIQEDKLLQLPSVCNVKNASISQCPKLLGLSPSSPDAAIFTNASKLTPTSSAQSSTSTPTTQSKDSSYGKMIKPSMIIDIIVLALAFLLIAIPTGFVSIYT